MHRGPFADLGRPSDFLRASLEALARGGPFPAAAGSFDAGRRILGLGEGARGVQGAEGATSSDAVIGDAPIGRGASIVRSTVWSGSRVGDGARLRDCVLGRGRVPAGADYRESLLWAADEDAEVAAIPL
jgi:NDP-sugar pyrophosphorylase family protein